MSETATATEPLTHRTIRPDSPIEGTKALLRQPPGPWPGREWIGYPSIVQAFKEMFHEAAQNVPAPPEFPIPRGIVICGGGWRFFPSVYVTVRIIRHIGCHLPIQVWYLGDRGEFDIRMLECLADYGVGWIDANAMWRDRPGMAIRRRNLDDLGSYAGWQLKPFAAAFCPFREVIALDADSYPVYNPEHFMGHHEYARVGASFWPDRAPLESSQYARFGIEGVPPEHCTGLESGQFIVDKGRHWAPLWLTCFLNAYSDYIYQRHYKDGQFGHLYGDKDTFNIAWRKVGHEMCIPTRRPGWSEHSFLQKDFDGRVLFVHRTQGKFKMFGEMDGAAIPTHYMTSQRGSGEQRNIYNAALPLEAEAHGFAARCDELLRPQMHFDYHANEHHLGQWVVINRTNSEYRFAPAYQPTDVALDVGGHVGAATHAMLSRGMGHVVVVEPVEANVLALRKNLAQRWGDRWTLVQAAAWRNDDYFFEAGRMGGPIPLYPRPADGDATVPNSFLPAEGATMTTAIPLDDLILRAANLSQRKRVRLLKIDIEGAEYPCLYSAKRLDLVDEIVGEWHDNVHGMVPSHAAVPGAPAYKGAALVQWFRDQGWEVETWGEKTWEVTGEGLGNFRAKRPENLI